MKYVVIRKHNPDMVKSMKELEVGEIVGKAIKSVGLENNNGHYFYCAVRC